MELIPEFELGLWNAWIFMVPSLLVTLLCLLVMTRKDAPGGPARVACGSNACMQVSFDKTCRTEANTKSTKEIPWASGRYGNATIRGY